MLLITLNRAMFCEPGFALGNVRFDSSLMHLLSTPVLQLHDEVTITVMKQVIPQIHSDISILRTALVEAKLDTDKEAGA